MSLTTLPEGVQCLHGISFLVDLDLLQLADEFDSDDAVFFNPRYASSDGSASSALGFDKASMDELYEAIKAEGMQNDLICRWVPDGVQVVDGERRKRTLDKLVENNEEVLDPATRTMKPAGEVYGCVVCKIHELDDCAANQYAFSMNDRARTIGDGATAAWVLHLRTQGMTDQEILAMTNKKIGWLKDTDALAQLDKVCWRALCNGEINRAAGLKLLKIEDLDKRHSALADGKTFAVGRQKVQIAEAQEEFHAAQQKHDVAEAEAVAAEIQGGEEVAQEKAKQTAATVAAKKAAVNYAESTTPPATGADIDKTQPAMMKPLTIAKVKKDWVGPCQEMVNDELPSGVDITDAGLIVTLGTAIDSGEGDITMILRNHKTGKEKMGV